MAIISVITSIILFLITACILYLKGYKKEAILIRQGIYSFSLIYTLLVLIIGLAPIN